MVCRSSSDQQATQLLQQNERLTCDRADHVQVGASGQTPRGRNKDEVYAAPYEAANGPVRDAMDLAYLTGQRPADTLRMQETDLRKVYLEVAQAKTGEKLRIAVSGQLAALIGRILEAKKRHAVRSLALVCNEAGGRLTASALDNRWDHVRRRAEARHPKLRDQIERAQFRDLRANRHRQGRRRRRHPASTSAARAPQRRDDGDLRPKTPRHESDSHPVSRSAKDLRQAAS